MLPTINHRTHLKSLDGIRGAAILMVVLFHEYPRSHYDPISYCSGLGWTGVDLFFVLSGFLITGILYDTRSQPGFFTNFFARRALRLLPVYTVMAALVIGVALALGHHLTWWAAPFFLYASNIVFNLRVPTGLNGIFNLDHLWSLAVEEQFYIFWAPTVFLLRTRRRILWACALASLFSIGLRLLPPHVFSIYYIPYNQLPTRLDGFLGGAALAMLVRGSSALDWVTPRRLHLAMATSAAVVFVCAVVSHSSYWSSLPMVRFGYAADAVLFTCMVARALQPASWVATIGELPFLRVLGRYSYGMYLWHMLPEPYFARFTRWAQHTSPSPELGRVAGFLVVFSADFAMAWVSYHAIELSFLKMKKYFAYRDEQRAHRLVIDQNVGEYTAQRTAHSRASEPGKPAISTPVGT